MPSYKRYHPVNHNFNRDPEIIEARKQFGDWIALAWQECLAIGDRNKGIVPGTIAQIGDIIAPVSLQKYHKRASDTAQNFLRFAAELGWIRIETNHIVIVKFAEYHKTREPKQAPSLPSLPSLPKNPKKDSLVPPPAEALEMAQLLSDLIFQNYPNRTPPTESQLMSWAKDAEKINRIDGHSWEDIRELIDWCQADPFWRANVLSMSKFREKWNQLLARKSTPTKQDQISSRLKATLMRGL
jgi:hypothetical protein